ncbi:hypothetical protein FA13DRAFT_1703979 [Coprinellus micaceus]|uniref:Uncharacterized protein n=1 Tax=Coprinellus micaceus TaxID=71717 RepID=A0A4Y7U0I5_COPMI|nr:hypothetical protein FA13DRAFT_1703979 [Coprinellus micaceus]
MYPPVGFGIRMVTPLMTYDEMKTSEVYVVVKAQVPPQGLNHITWMVTSHSLHSPDHTTIHIDRSTTQEARSIIASRENSAYPGLRETAERRTYDVIWAPFYERVHFISATWVQGSIRVLPDSVLPRLSRESEGGPEWAAANTRQERLRLSKVSEDEPADANRSPLGCDTVTGDLGRHCPYLIASKHTITGARTLNDRIPHSVFLRSWYTNCAAGVHSLWTNGRKKRVHLLTRNLETTTLGYQAKGPTYWLMNMSEIVFLLFQLLGCRGNPACPNSERTL